MATASFSQTSPATVPPQQPGGGNATGPLPAVSAAPPSAASRLSFDEVAKHFNVPIADAASALGVCSSVLKRICRENGVIRWPYRKYLAGKTVDDIKKDAAKEKGKEFAELSRVSGHTQDSSKLQKGFSAPGHVPQQQGTKLFPDGHGMFQPSHSIPDYVDEFKYGFPVDGLSSSTPQWWGNSTSDSTEEELPRENEKPGEEGLPSEAPEKAGDAAFASKNVSLLCSIRQRAVVEGEESNRLGISRGYGHYKLGKKERSVLVQVFKSSLPCEWKYYFS